MLAAAVLVSEVLIVDFEVLVVVVGGSKVEVVVDVLVGSCFVVVVAGSSLAKDQSPMETAVGFRSSFSL